MSINTENSHSKEDVNKFISLKNLIEFPIPQDLIKSICFAETLLISVNEIFNKSCDVSFCDCDVACSNQIGGYCVNIEEHGLNLAIIITSQFSYNSESAKSVIFSITDRDLNLIEDKKVETILGTESEREKSLHIAKDNEDYIMFRKTSECRKYRGTFKSTDVENFVTDGMGFILQRYMILKTYVGQFEVSTIDIDGLLYPSKYIFSEPEMVCVNKKRTLLTKVIRIIFKKDSSSDKITMYFLSTGHLVRHHWSSCDISIHINPFSPIPPTGYILDLHEKWQDDIELVSKFLDYKEKIISASRTYFHNNPKFKTLIEDYKIMLLHSNSSNVLDLTLDDFINLSGNFKAHKDLVDSISDIIEEDLVL